MTDDQIANALGAAIAALLTSSLAMTGCEKAADGGATAPVAASDNGGGASTVPGLPFLAKPVFSPDLIDMVGGVDLFARAEGKLALTQSNAADVKSYASTSIDAHTKSTAALSQVSEADGQTLSMPDIMPANFQLKVAALQKLTGPAFDKAYLADQIALQQAEATALRFYAKHGDVAQFKTFAADTAAALDTNVAAAQTLQSSLK